MFAQFEFHDKIKFYICEMLAGLLVFPPQYSYICAYIIEQNMGNSDKMENLLIFYLTKTGKCYFK